MRPVCICAIHLVDCMTAVGPSTHAGSGVKYTYVGCKGHTVDSKERERDVEEKNQKLSPQIQHLSPWKFFFSNTPPPCNIRSVHHKSPSNWILREMRNRKIITLKSWTEKQKKYRQFPLICEFPCCSRT